MSPRAEVAAAALGVVLLIGAGAWLERRPETQDARRRLNSQAVPAPLLDTGKLGTLLQRADLVEDVPNDGALFSPTIGGTLEDDPFVFRRKARVGETLYEARDGRASTFPVSALPEGLAPEDELLVISIAVDPADLDVIHERYDENVERRAEVTVYASGAPVLTTRAVLRLHGGNSRKPGLQHSYRLHLRDRYGLTAFPDGMLFEGALDPVPTLIVRRVVSQRFNSVLGYDIHARLGAEVPHTQPAWFYLNGELMGLYVLSERLSPKVFRTRIGHDDFFLFRQRGVTGGKDARAHERLQTWITEQGKDLRAVDLAQYLDVDALTRYLLAIAFCGTVDWEQGAAYLDLRDPASRWKWMPWDLDRGLAGQSKAPPFGILLDDPLQRRTSVPARALALLLEHDLDYRETFVAEASVVLNHLLTTEYLEERQAHYGDLGARWGPAEERDPRRKFLRERRQRVLDDLTARYDLGPVRSCVVRAGGQPLEVDGHAHGVAYRGLHFDGQTLRVRAEGVSVWRVNDQMVREETLELVVDGDMVVMGIRR